MSRGGEGEGRMTRMLVLTWFVVSSFSWLSASRTVEIVLFEKRLRIISE